MPSMWFARRYLLIAGGGESMFDAGARRPSMAQVSKSGEEQDTWYPRECPVGRVPVFNAAKVVALKLSRSVIANNFVGEAGHWSREMTPVPGRAPPQSPSGSALHGAPAMPASL